MQKHKKVAAVAAAVAGIIGVGFALAQPAPGPMSFFLTSAGSGMAATWAGSPARTDLPKPGPGGRSRGARRGART